MSELDEIFPVARIKVFTGEYKLYTDMSELDKEIKEVDVYSKEQVLKLLEPQLTIPKSIADLADKEAFADPHTKFKMFIERYELNRLNRRLNLYCCTEEGRETVFAYINPLTRDLVKVVEG